MRFFNTRTFTRVIAGVAGIGLAVTGLIAPAPAGAQATTGVRATAIAVIDAGSAAGDIVLDPAGPNVSTPPEGENSNQWPWD
jgi:hypothetical protein